MTPRQIRIVQSTWPRVLAVKDAAAQRFYRRLFEMDPSLEAMFLGDMREQGRRLMQVIDAAVSGLSNLEQIVDAVRELGIRHAGYCVKDHHYDTAGSALLWALDHSLGEAFTEDVNEAWASAYQVLASTMREGATLRAGNSLARNCP